MSSTPADDNVRRRNRTYYAGDLRRALLDATLEVIIDEGPAAVSLRALSRRLGVSHAAPANHFPDKATLFTALATEGFRLLGEALTAAANALPDDGTAIGGLRATGLAYVRFARDHRGHFEVMWRNDLLHNDDPDLVAVSRDSLTCVINAAAAAQAEGWAPDAHPMDAVELAWATVHGIAALWLNGPLQQEDPRSLDEIAASVTRLLAP